MDITPLRAAREENATNSSFNGVASQLIRARRWEEAGRFLLNALQKMPVGWSPVREHAASLEIAFWSQDEFLRYSWKRRPGKSVFWIPGSYSRAWYQLAQMFGEQSRLIDASLCLHFGTALEPDHPDLWCEKGYILGRLRNFEDGLHCFERAATARDWATQAQLARAFRGQGGMLIDLHNLDQAEAAFNRSLAIEPENPLAKQELEYIHGLRSTGA